MKIKLLIGIILLLSSLSMVNAAETDEYNFTIGYQYQAGSPSQYSQAQFIRESLKPLGINVELEPLPWGVYVGNLLHYNEYDDFDLASIRFVGERTTPEFMWSYHSTRTSFGQSIYQLHLPEWQEWQLTDVGVETADVNQLLEDIEFELDLNVKNTLTQEFNELYMTKLLYDLPLNTRIGKAAMWKGYGGTNNELWNPDLGVIESRMLGATWTSDTPSQRISANNHLRLSTVTPGKSEMFDPNQAFDRATAEITKYMHDSLLYFDQDEQIHPGIAWNWYFRDSGVLYDHDNDVNTAEVNSYELVYFLRDDAMWAETTDVNGNIMPTEAVDAQDFVLAFDMYKHPLTVLNGKEQFDPIVDYFSSTSITPDDTFTIRINANEVTPDDYFTYSKITPVPAHLLGGELHMGALTAKVSDFASWNPQSSDEWIQWESKAGHSLVGPYDIVNYVKGEYHSYIARDDYYYPNEDDVATFYDAAGLSNIETFTGFDLSVFAPHMNVINPTPHFWAWNTPAKPTSQGIKTFEYVVINDINANLLAFVSGNIDFIGISGFGVYETMDYEDNSDYIVKETISARSPELMIFGLSNPHLMKFNVRLAIAHALDRELMNVIHSGFALKHDSVVWMHLGYYYDDSFGIDYDLDVAKALMELEGYNIPSNAFSDHRDLDGLGELNLNLDTGNELSTVYIHEEILAGEIPVVDEMNNSNSIFWFSSILLFVPIVILKRKY